MRYARWFFVALVLAVVLVGGGTVALAATATLTWTDNSTNETGFNIERKGAACVSTAVAWIEVDLVGANVKTYVDLAVQPGVTYCYRVAASNSAGKSAYSNEVAITIPLAVPAPPTGLGVVGAP